MEQLLLEHGLEYVESVTSKCIVAYQINQPAPLSLVKHIDLSREEFERECRFAKLAQEQDIGVDVLDCIPFGDGGFLVLELWDMTVDAFLVQKLYKVPGNLATLRRGLRAIRRTMRALGLIHADLIPRNVVCQVSNRRVQSVRLIDFGLSFWRSELQTGLEWPELQVLHNHIFHNVEWPHLRGIEPPSLEAVRQEPELLDKPLFDFIESL